ncbi:hypothetical protein OG474_44010 [Kribbella sp. NBC_01505]|uniref:hypothetical protein n=1 Tax=Kribbella sp. NBC_01505 TaxID=2903580 RepID=UPI003870015D
MRAGIFAFITLTLAVVANVVLAVTGSGTFLWICAVLYPVGLIFGALEWAERRRAFRTPVDAEAADVRQLGLRAQGIGDRKAAERLLRVAAEQGDVESMWELATLLMQRDGLAAGEPWVQLAAENGHSLAQAFLRAQKNF